MNAMSLERHIFVCPQYNKFGAVQCQSETCFRMTHLSEWSTPNTNLKHVSERHAIHAKISFEFVNEKEMLLNTTSDQ